MNKKSASPSYFNDVFLPAALLFDARSEDLVVLITSVSYERNDAARYYLEADYHCGSPDTGQPTEPPWAGVMVNIFGLE